MWMIGNKLSCNDDKTEMMIMSSKILPPQEVKLNDDCSVTTNTKVRNLGVMFDQNLSMLNHVKVLTKSLNFQIKKIGHIRNFINESVTKKLVTSLILSRLDYCNSLLANTSKELIHPLQKCQNNAARLIMRVKKRDHITPLLKQLHWLPVRYRINYKIITFCFKVLNGLAPKYFQIDGHFCIYAPTRALRSANDKTIFVEPGFKYKRFGSRSFYFYGPYLWNRLPKELRHITSLSIFKARLKTFLFLQAFD